MKTLLFLVLLLSQLCIGAAAQAAEAPQWELLAKKCTVTFTADYSGENVSGIFPTLLAKIRFHPDALADSSVDVRIPLALFTSDDSDATEYLPQEEWFDIAQHPMAHFVSTEITAVDTAHFIAKGTLTLKGHTKPLELAFTFSPAPDGMSAHIVGSATLARLDYEIGQGEWTSTKQLADAVRIDIRLEAMRSKEPD